MQQQKRRAVTAQREGWRGHGGREEAKCFARKKVSQVVVVVVVIQRGGIANNRGLQKQRDADERLRGRKERKKNETEGEVEG